MIGHEGGYSNHPSDRGGETWRGISRKHWPKWAGWKIVDSLKEEGDTVEDIDAVLKLNADLPNLEIEFYKENFWDVVKGDKLPIKVASELFDTAVNCGVSNAGKFFQNAINFLNKGGSIFKDIQEDGKVGATTLAAFDAIRLHYGNRYGKELFTRRFLLACNGEQYMYYKGIGDRNPNQETFSFGWLKRVEND